MAKNRTTPSRRSHGSLEERSGQPKRLIVFSLRFLDPAQGQTFSDWEGDSILSIALERIRSVSNLSVEEIIGKKIIKVYPAFPDNSDFCHPKHVPESAKWATFHIQGKECIIGFLESNVFNIVFLDKDHRFWITEKKGT
jgi:hypothetical protein